MSSRLVIKSHHPRRQRFKQVLAGLVVLLAGWGIFVLGQWTAGYDNAALRQERDRLHEQLASGQDANRRLRESLAVLERTAQIDKQAYGQVEQSLRQVQDEILELKEEVAFYRGIVSPAEAASGLSITRFNLAGMGEEQEGVYRFKLVLSQLKTNNRLVKGQVRLNIDGVRAGKQTQLDLKDVSGGTLDRLKLRFKYFQTIEGDIVLPRGFLPSRVTVEVIPKGKGWTRFKKVFDWSAIIKPATK